MLSSRFEGIREIGEENWCLWPMRILRTSLVKIPKFGKPEGVSDSCLLADGVV